MHFQSSVHRSNHRIFVPESATRLRLPRPFVLPISSRDVVRRGCRAVMVMWLAVATSLFTLFPSPAEALVFVVNSLGNARDEIGSVGDGQCSTGADITLDDGQLEPECTLTAAIEEANAWPGRDQIHFSNPVIYDDLTNVATFEMTQSVTGITDPLDIDGRTAPSYMEGESPRVLLRPSGLALPAAFVFGAGSADSTIQAIAIQNYRIGILLNESDGAWIDGCDLGFFAPSSPLQGTVDGNDYGIFVSSLSRNTHIGKKVVDGEFEGFGNVISGNRDGILVDSDLVWIVGNRIGTNREGNRIETLSGTSLGNDIGININNSTNVRIGRSIFLPVGEGTPPILEYSESLGNVISGNHVNGIWISSPGSPAEPLSVSIQANSIGTDLAGDISLPNAGHGIYVAAVGGSGSPILIGSPFADPNIISGNGGSGISGTLLGESPVEIVRNHIGVDRTGLLTLPNGAPGIFISKPVDLVIQSNIVGGNVGGGIWVDDDIGLPFSLTHVIEIHDNWVGSNPMGARFGNSGPGIRLESQTPSTGSLTITGNFVGDNAVGIELSDLNGDALLARNYIGTNALGADLGNRGNGIFTANLGSSLVIGDILLGGNVVGWNAGSGISINPAALGTTLSSNDIGVTPSGVYAPNGVDGIRIRPLLAAPPSTRVVVGAQLSDLDSSVQNVSNRIAFNLRNGITLDPDSYATIRGNEIKENVLLAIDLESDGASANDSGDADPGANLLQNFPGLDASNSRVDWHTGALDLRFLVDSNPAHSPYPLKVDFYLADASGRQTERFLGSVEYESADAQTWQDEIIDPLIQFPPFAQQIVAIATDAAGNTSEVGPPITVPEPGFAFCLAIASAGLAASAGARRRGLYSPLHRKRCKTRARIEASRNTLFLWNRPTAIGETTSEIDNSCQKRFDTRFQVKDLRRNRADRLGTPPGDGLRG